MRRNVADYSEFVAMRWPSLVLPVDSSDAGPLALTMTFTDDGGVAYAVTDSPEHTNRWDVVVCDPSNGPCRTVSGDLDGGVFFANQRIQ